jgi:hypothetical protein
MIRDSSAFFARLPTGENADAGEEPSLGIGSNHCEKKYNKQVTTENATRLFELSERLCGIRYE